ncbi:uncharacterized protein LOC105441710 [Strongylocentrotus purpuratus]|uniref:Uncharacterized protein n=1 Tax=Strongylocentrotus purpuratus TaxID=7668 RepID=A0A7M7HFG3_STRPU|nr:uncharacterized protein LOC105441710 [Strongylocentrotus purpuratus]
MYEMNLPTASPSSSSSSLSFTNYSAATQNHLNLGDYAICSTDEAMSIPSTSSSPLLCQLESEPPSDSCPSEPDPPVPGPSTSAKSAKLSQRSSAEGPNTPPPLKRQKACLFDTEMILNQSPDGVATIEEIKRLGFVAKRTRHVLVSRLVEYLIMSYGERPESFVKAALAQSIITTFPSLRDPEGNTGFEAFYTRGVSGHPATGYLEEHLRYVRKKTKQSKARSSSSTVTAAAACSQQECSLPTEEDALMVSLMKDNKVPDEQKSRFMAETFDFRRKWIQNQERSVREILTEFPCLLEEGMIEQDFQLLHSESAEKLKEKWTTMSGHLIAYCKEMFPLWPQVLNLPGNMDTQALSSEEKSNLAFFMVPLLFEKKTRKAGCSSTSHIRNLESFIDTQLETTHMPSYLQQIDPTTRPQPFIIELFSSSKLRPQQTFTVIEKECIPHKSLIDAVDVCYKAHFIIDCAYQSNVEGTWLFFQKMIYEQNDKRIRDTPALSSFRAYLFSKKT